MNSKADLLLLQAGWNPHWQRIFDSLATPDLIPARVSMALGSQWRVWCELGECLCEVSGASWRAAVPCTGDWVAIEPNAAGNSRIRHLLPRRTKFSRKAAGAAFGEQVVAANVDTVFLVMALDEDFSLRRLERYLVTAQESGAQPVVVLNKADACDNVAERVAAVRDIAPDVPVYSVSARNPASLSPLQAYVAAGETIALLGSSGVGKSTIINAFLGEDRLKTSEVSADDNKGRHTTTRRELVLLPGGGLLMDTPGMRELQLWCSDESLDSVFAEVSEASTECHFRDCTHAHEPGCAVRAKVEAGEIDADRLASYQKLSKELAYLEQKDDLHARLEEKRRWKVITRAAEKMIRKRDR